VIYGLGAGDKTGEKTGSYGLKSEAIDGKTLRGSFTTRQGSTAIHLVSAWATENRLVFAPVKTEAKSKGNEVSTITAIPAWLEMIALKGCIVTIDAADFSPRGARTK
jgi:hypothetical protein